MANPFENFIKSLIDSLHNLLLKVSGQMRDQHLENSKMDEAKGNVDIWGRLGSFLEATPELSDEDYLHLSDEHKHETDKAHANDNLHKPTLEQGAELSELGKYYQRKLRVEVHPHMGEQMQHNTMDHINLALHLARKGDQAGAKLHIELAESAMHTAGRFLSQDEYNVFETKVENRLAAIIDRGHQQPLSK